VIQRQRAAGSGQRRHSTDVPVEIFWPAAAAAVALDDDEVEYSSDVRAMHMTMGGLCREGRKGERE
jgi:hypothetical protein